MTNKILSTPYQSDKLSLKNRFVMAPLTRQRAGTGQAPTAMNALYYAQRASAGLIISEASQISSQAVGYPNTPGIYTKNQISGWRLITEAVHESGGKIFIQLWHVGRHSHPFLQENGQLPVGPSAVKEIVQITTPQGKMEPVVPHALTCDEIVAIVNDYRQAAINAMDAGFDGVEIHGANGYLIDQFLNDTSNLREDDYGGTIEKKSRFALEVVDAVVKAIGSERTGIRLSPSGTNFGVRNVNPVGTFDYVIEKLNAFSLAYLHLIEPVQSSIEILPQYLKEVTSHYRKIYVGTLITSAGYNFETAEKVIQSGDADLVAFGKDFISNPDLVERYAKDASLNMYDINTFYGGKEVGYTDYPFIES
jgi:N-ethylmaleimide reductase